MTGISKKDTKHTLVPQLRTSKTVLTNNNWGPHICQLVKRQLVK